jgi:hypothetical protein
LPRQEFYLPKIVMLEKNTSTVQRYTCTPAGGKTRHYIDNVMTDRRRYSSTLFIQYYRVAGSDADQLPVIANIRDRLSVTKRTTQKSGNHKKLSDTEVK